MADRPRDKPSDDDDDDDPSAATPSGADGPEESTASTASAPPPPPPGFEDVKAGTHAGDSLAEDVEALQVRDAGGGAAEGTVDAPDPSLERALTDLDDEAAQQETKISKVTVEGTLYQSAHTFEELGLSPELLQGLYVEMKFEKPSKVQAETLPMILRPPYASLIAQSHNGSGKTTCFVLGMLSRIDPKLSAPQALCMCPTRELVVQNQEVAARVGKFAGIRICTTADADAKDRREAITDQLVVGTAGTIKTWASVKKILRLNHMRVLVFDEADEMLAQSGFQADSERLMMTIRQQAPACQLLLFSATFSDRVKEAARRIVSKATGAAANEVWVERAALSLDVIKQFAVRCPTPAAKLQVLSTIFPLCEKLGQSIVFVRTREAARALHLHMEGEGYRCTSIEGGMDPKDRDKVIREFRTGKTKTLIATDVLSRGFDCTTVTLVINYDMPVDRDGRTPAFETYMHRIGRSGRFGRKGAAFNLVHGPVEKAVLDAIARHFHREIPDVPHNDEESFEAVLKEAGLA